MRACRSFENGASRPSLLSAGQVASGTMLFGLQHRRRGSVAGSTLGWARRGAHAAALGDGDADDVKEGLHEAMGATKPHHDHVVAQHVRQPAAVVGMIDVGSIDEVD